MTEQDMAEAALDGLEATVTTYRCLTGIFGGDDACHGKLLGVPNKPLWCPVCQRVYVWAILDDKGRIRYTNGNKSLLQWTHD